MSNDGSTREAFLVCALASYDALKAALARSDPSSTAGMLLAATVWQCEGDILRTETALRHAAENASDDDRPYVVDMLAPVLISRGLFIRAGTLLGTAVVPLPLEIGRRALRAVIDAAMGNIRCSDEHQSVARAALTRVEDEALRMRVHQRLALAAYYRGRPLVALDEVARGLRSARLLAAHRCGRPGRGLGWRCTSAAGGQQAASASSEEAEDSTAGQAPVLLALIAKRHVRPP